MPKNEFVNLMWRTNDMPIADPDALHDDTAARATMANWHYIPTRPGGLAEAVRAIQPNEVYNTHLRLIFYDAPPFGHYQPWFDAIFRDPRYTDLRANLQHFSALYRTILATRPAAGPPAGRDCSQRKRFHPTPGIRHYRTREREA